MKIKTLLIVTLLACGLCTVSACRKSVNNNPAVVQAMTLQDAENAVKSVEDGLKAANDTVESLQSAEPGYYAKLKPILRRISSLNATASSKINGAAQGNATNWQGALSDVANSITPADLTTFGFKNPNSQLAAQAGMTLLQTALNTLKSKFGTAELKFPGPVCAPGYANIAANGEYTQFLVTSTCVKVNLLEVTL